MGTGWDVAANFVNLLSRFPFERLFDRGPNDKALDALESRLKEKGLLRRNRRFGNQPLAKLPFCLPPPLPTIAKEDEVKRGTAATIWSDEHVTQATGDLTKALRMACTRGVKDVEVRKRPEGACSELAWAASPQGKRGDCLWVSGDKDSHRGCSNIFGPLSVNKRGFCSLHQSLFRAVR
jgi:hypothetical protein